MSRILFDALCFPGREFVLSGSGVEEEILGWRLRGARGLWYCDLGFVNRIDLSIRP